MVRPYNFYLNPIPEVRLDIERIFSFQSGGEYRNQYVILIC